MNKEVKIIALYLPQFYEFEENNKWWGKGYTDWQAVKSNKCLFEGHIQPRVPLNNNYYDLSKKATIEWQADLAKKYHIDGFCIYHYYNKGKLMMDKPIETIIDNPDLNLSYFFSWANHDFKKTWFNNDGRLLLKQEYGNENDWRNHFHYLIKFFKDDRYIKIDNKPVFTIYNIHHIAEFEDMVKLWQQLAIENGFDGLHIIATKSNTNTSIKEMYNNPMVNAVMIFEPLNARSNGANENRIYVFNRRFKTVLLKLNNRLFRNHMKVEKYNYSKINELMLNRKTEGKQYYCSFTSWDNTPRYQGKGIVFTDSTPKLFENYLELMYKRSIREKNEFLFINAWNEWGETAYLEPDEYYRYEYLEAVKNVVELNTEKIVTNVSYNFREEDNKKVI